MTALDRRNARRYVLDANALVSFFEGRKEAGEKVRRIFEEALRRDMPVLMSAVNWGEVFYVVWRRHGEGGAKEAESRLQELPIIVIAADRDRASRAGALKEKHGLGYADAYAAELAVERDAWLVTADPEFARTGKSLQVYSLPRYEK